MTGLVITVTVLGAAQRERVVRRNGARLHDLVCITGNLGAAYMGLRLLERERRVLSDVKNPEPRFGATNTCSRSTSSRVPAPTSSRHWPRRASSPRR